MSFSVFCIKEKNVYEHQQPNSQQVQQNRKPSRFHQGPQPILSQPPPQVVEIMETGISGLQNRHTVGQHQQSNGQPFQQKEKQSGFHKVPQPLLNQPPPQIEQSQENEECVENIVQNVDQNQQSNSQQFQQNEKRSRFHQGPQPLLGQHPPQIKKLNKKNKVVCKQRRL